jgi:putative inorganic carbon (hco3(-)) transporter
MTPGLIAPNANSSRATPFPNIKGAGNPFQAIGFAILLAFLFILFSRTFDVVLTSLQIPFVVSCLVLAATIFGGGIFRIVKHKIGRYLLAFTVWMALAVPFSFWRGGSISTLQSWLKALLVYICIVGLIATFDQTLRAIKVLGFSVLTLAFVALLMGNSDSGRLFLTDGKFQNPNDLAQMLLMGLPFIWLIVKDSSQNLLFKIPPFLLSGVIFYVMLKTGSRGAIFGFLALLVYVFFRASMTDRIGLVLLTLFLAVFTLVAIPASLRNRYTTLFSSDADDRLTPGADLSEIAVASSEARSRVLKLSLMMTLQHPIFGVGPGMFADAVEDDFKQQGKHTTFLLTHNSYTQVSSEMGFPGLFLYLAVLFSCFGATGSVIKASRGRHGHRWQNINNTAACLRMLLVAYSVTALFSSVAYQTLFPVVAALCTTLYLSVRDELAAQTAADGLVIIDAPAPRPSRLPALALQNAGRQRA